MGDQAVIAATCRWVQEVVIGLNLCPFAELPMERDAIRYQVCNQGEQDAIYRALLEEMACFVELPEEQAETGLFIAPCGLEAFDDYLELLYSADQALPEAGLDGVIQLASFHPDYQFEGSDMDDPANYTNRSPFPMFHLIREQGMAQALENYPDPEQIPERNIRTLRNLGLAEMQRRLASITPSSAASPRSRPPGSPAASAPSTPVDRRSRILPGR